MVCKCSLVERLDLLPMAVLLMIGGNLPAKTGTIRSRTSGIYQNDLRGTHLAWAKRALPARFLW